MIDHNAIYACDRLRKVDLRHFPIDDMLDDFAVRRAVPHAPLTDDELTIPSFDSFHGLDSRAERTPPARGSGAQPLSPPAAGLRLIRGAIATALELIGFAIAVGAVLLALILA